MTSPLRPALYNRLRQVFGKVVVANPGEAALVRVRLDDSGRKRLQTVKHGEAYRINCPYCSDTKARCWISYEWGFKNEETNSLNLHLCWCHNETECLRSYSRQKAMYDQLFDPTTPYRDRRLAGDVIEEGIQLPEKPLPAEMPGQVTPLDQLPLDHRANCYLRSRGYTIEFLSTQLGVGYCTQTLPRYTQALDRIIIPIYMRGELVGWQGRLSYDSDNKFAAKYYSLPGMRKGSMLYNFDLASKSPFVVVCEGPTDVWSFGPEAVAIFGKSLSTVQRQLVGSCWQTVVILLDGDAADEIQGIYDSLKANRKQTIVPVILSDGKDPGDFHTQFLRDTVRAAAAKAGVSLTL